MERHSPLGTGTLEPTQSHSTPSHTHRVTHTQSHVMSFRALNLTDLGAPTCSLVPQGGLAQRLCVTSLFLSPHADLDTHP